MSDEIVEYEDRRFRIVREDRSVRIELRDDWRAGWAERGAAIDEMQAASADGCLCCPYCMSSVCHPDSEVECVGDCEHFRDLVDDFLEGAP